MEGHCCRYCGGRLSLTNKVPLPWVRLLVDDIFRGYVRSFAWHVRSTRNGGIEVLIKKKLGYSEIDILEATYRAKRLLQSKFHTLSFSSLIFSFSILLVTSLSLNMYVTNDVSLI